MASWFAEPHGKPNESCSEIMLPNVTDSSSVNELFQISPFQRFIFFFGCCFKNKLQSEPLLLVLKWYLSPFFCSLTLIWFSRHCLFCKYWSAVTSYFASSLLCPLNCYTKVTSGSPWPLSRNVYLEVVLMLHVLTLCLSCLILLCCGCWPWADCLYNATLKLN